MTKKGIPKELEGVAFSEDVNAIQEQVNHCYSKQRYEEFQEAVEKVVGRYMKSTYGWAFVVWFVSIFGGMLAQKFLDIF